MPIFFLRLRISIHREFNGKDLFVYYLLRLQVINARRGGAIIRSLGFDRCNTAVWHCEGWKVSTIRGGFVTVARHFRDWVGSLWSCQGRTAPWMWRASLPHAGNSSLFDWEKGPLFHKSHGLRAHVEGTSMVHRGATSLSLGKPCCGVLLINCYQVLKTNKTNC